MPNPDGSSTTENAALGLPRTGSAWVKTYTGRRVWPLDFRPEDVHVTDIIHSLSQLCRFNGHTRAFYSVAEHSSLVAHEVWRRTKDPTAALQGLMHDAAEAYIGDVVRPLKKTKEFYFYNEVEEHILNVIFDKLELWIGGDYISTVPMHTAVFEVDAEILVIEGEILLDGTHGWGITRHPHPDFRRSLDRLQCLSPNQAKTLMYQTWNMLWGDKKRRFKNNLKEDRNVNNPGAAYPPTENGEVPPVAGAQDTPGT